MPRWLQFASLLIVGLAFAASAQGAPREHIEIIASPSAYAFASRIADEFAKDARLAEPRTESSGEALARFCAGVGLAYPDVALVTQALSAQSERACRAAGVTPVEVVLGSAGLVVLKSASAPSLALTQRELFLAIAKDVPVGGGQQFASNSFDTWDAIDPRLPKTPIEVIGPPQDSPAASALGDLLLGGGARSFSALEALEARDPKAFARFAGAVRPAPAYRPRPENLDPEDLLAASPGALVIGNLVSANGRKGVAVVAIDGHLPREAAIADGSYPLARPVRLFLKREHVGVVAGLPELLDEALGGDALGEHGYLRPLGLIPGPRGKFGVTAGAILSKTR